MAAVTQLQSHRELGHEVCLGAHGGEAPDELELCQPGGRKEGADVPQLASRLIGCLMLQHHRLSEATRTLLMCMAGRSLQVEKPLAQLVS